MLFSPLIFYATLLVIVYAFPPNLNVLKVSSYCVAVGVAVQITLVNEFPPNEDDKILVRLEFLYGI